MGSFEITFAPGDVVAGLEPSELVEIQRIAPFGSKTLVEGVGVQSRRVVRRPLTSEELSALTKVRGQNYTFQGDSRLFLLGAEAERIRIAHQFDPLFAVNSSIVDPLPHQVEAVYRYLLPLPRIRFLLADDTGAGKTIMTGLLIKELLFRGVIQKILIITPGGLTKQWAEEELQEKFGLYARLVNRASFDAEPGQFARYDEGFFVSSIDFLARNEGCLKAAAETQWDLIVVDEAHKLSAYEYGTKLDESERYKAIKELARKTDHLLFLTATPHRGRKNTFRRLLLLLDEDLFQKDEHVDYRLREQAAPYASSSSEDFESERPISKARNRFFLRRLKEEMVDWDNKPLFKDRHTKTVGYDLTPEEKTLYEEVTRYVRSKRKEAKAKKNRNVELTLMVMQRRLASSLFAITRTLENRLKALNAVLAILTDPTRSEAEKKRLLRGTTDPSEPRDIAEYEDLTEEEREVVDQRIFRQVLTDDPTKIEEERDEIERLFRHAQSLRTHREAKFLELLSVLDSSDVIRAEQEKLLIFTEHRDTLETLASRLEQMGYTVTRIHGGMDVDARKQAQREFLRRAKIMVATDAAGEGINLQFCRFLINWDIPWNPNRLEQRMGRIHRYGQHDDVHVYNLVAQNTREGAVLHKVLSKLDIMREQMGSDRVYDVIDEWLEDVPLVFDKQLVSIASKVRVPERTKLMGPGHPLFDTLIEWAIREARHAFAKGAVLVDPNIAKPQRVWLVRSLIEDGRRERRDRRKIPAHERLTGVAQDYMGIRATSPSYLLNCMSPETEIQLPDLPGRPAEEIQAWAYEEITENQLRQVKVLRTEECDVRREYLNTAFTDLILELQEELNDLQQAHLFGEENAEEQDRLRKRIEDLKARKEVRLKELELMMRLAANLPDVLTEAVVVPAPVATVEGDKAEPAKGVPMRRDDEVEAIAMDVSMRYERSRGWTPVDVSRDGEHYDIRSEGANGDKRYIEVKGRAQSGAIVLTGPEVDKLRQLGERAWLYIVTFCKPGLSPSAPLGMNSVEGGERPRLRTIQDPISKLSPEVLYCQIQYLVDESDWTGQGEVVNW